MTSTDSQPKASELARTDRSDERSEKKELPPLPKPDRDCCQSGCFGCEWADAMRARQEL